MMIGTAAATNTVAWAYIRGSLGIGQPALPDYLHQRLQNFPPKENVELNDLTDMVDNVVEGGIVMAKALGNQNWRSAK
ncbi:MAG: hypothetical protein CMM74_05340 [Rhodospirillaceae bacterium]|nr:hypothetical protein [Rhodospirillaceae bacterium]